MPDDAGPRGRSRAEPPPSAPTIRVASPDEHARARAAYEAWGYDGGVQPADTVFLAEEGERGELVGVVRLTLEEGVRMLRGMQVAPEARRRGVGTRLLEALVARLGDADPCWCVPYDHLLAFYGQGGFVEHALEGAPPFLVERIGRYRREGLAVTLMRRPPGGAGPTPRAVGVGIGRSGARPRGDGGLRPAAAAEILTPHAHVVARRTHRSRGACLRRRCLCTS